MSGSLLKIIRSPLCGTAQLQWYAPHWRYLVAAAVSEPLNQLSKTHANLVRVINIIITVLASLTLSIFFPYFLAWTSYFTVAPYVSLVTEALRIK